MSSQDVDDVINKLSDLNIGQVARQGNFAYHICTLYFVTI